MTVAYYLETEKVRKHDPAITAELADRKYVVLFQDGGTWQWASADDPTDEREGWALGGFAGDDDDVEWMRENGRVFNWGGL